MDFGSLFCSPLVEISDGNGAFSLFGPIVVLPEENWTEFDLAVVSLDATKN